jgi:hypothetical protein
MPVRRLNASSEGKKQMPQASARNASRGNEVILVSTRIPKQKCRMIASHLNSIGGHLI